MKYGSDREIQLFVSSTFADMRRERDLLHEFVFPRVTAHCKTLGIDFHPIDLRWGIQEEASNHHQVPEICLENVTRVSGGMYQPKLLLLIGQRAGWLPLPPWLDENQVELELQHLTNELS